MKQAVCSNKSFPSCENGLRCVNVLNKLIALFMVVVDIHWVDPQIARLQDEGIKLGVSVLHVVNCSII